MAIHDDTTALISKPKRMVLSPETQTAVTLGALGSGAVALVVGTIFVWTIKTTGETALCEIRALRDENKALTEKVQRLWYEYETRTASRRATPGGRL